MKLKILKNSIWLDLQFMRNICIIDSDLGRIQTFQCLITRQLKMEFSFFVTRALCTRFTKRVKSIIAVCATYLFV